MTQINIKATSNDTILKFEANRFLTKHTSFEFNNIEDAKNSPLAQQLFHLPFVKKVYITSNFIAIERFDIVDWKDVKDEVASQIENYLSKGGVIIKEDPQKTKEAITLYTESTPNPSVLKFVCNRVITPNIYEFTSVEQAKDAPLAGALFEFSYVKYVFMEKNYISITKYDEVEWEDVALQLRTFIKSYLEDQRPVMNKERNKSVNKIEADREVKFELLDDTSKNIVKILDEFIKPAVQSDGGNIEFKNFNHKTKIVDVLLQGACNGCPSSTYTLKNGIETMLRDMLNDDEIEVNAING